MSSKISAPKTGNQLRQIVFQLKQFSLLYPTTNPCRCLISLESCQTMHQMDNPPERFLYHV